MKETNTCETRYAKKLKKCEGGFENPFTLSKRYLHKSSDPPGKEEQHWDFPGGSKNLSATAGDTGSFNPWSSKIPHNAGQLSPSATTTEPIL